MIESKITYLTNSLNKARSQHGKCDGILLLNININNLEMVDAVSKSTLLPKIEKNIRDLLTYENLLLIEQIHEATYIALFDINNISSEIYDLIKDIDNNLYHKLPTKISENPIFLNHTLGYSFRLYKKIMINTPSKVLRDMIIESYENIHDTDGKEVKFLYLSEQEGQKTPYMKYSEEFYSAIKILNYIKDKKLRLDLQPIVYSSNENILCYEGLLRINNIEENIGNLIQVAEKYNFVRLIDIEVIRMACELLNKYSKLVLSINISRLSASCLYMKSQINNIIDENLNVSNRLIIEITENGNIPHSNISMFRDFVLDMHKKQVRIAIDDFGIGWNSLYEIKNLPIDIIKIDGEFIKDIDSNSHSEKIVHFMSSLIKEMNIISVAEYVENQKIAEILNTTDISCHQGFHYGKPQKVEYYFDSPII